LSAAKACLKVTESCKEVAKDIEKYVLPYDDIFRKAYTRFDVPFQLPYFEFQAKDFILAQVFEYLEARDVATKVAHVASTLDENTYPKSWEDRVAIASLSYLLVAFISDGHAKEAEYVSDAISTFALYGSLKSESGSQKKIFLATSANRLAHSVRNREPWSEPGQQSAIPRNFSSDFFLNSLLAYGQFEARSENLDPVDPLGQLTTMSEITAGAHFLLDTAKRRNQQEIESSLFQSILRQLSTRVGSDNTLNPATLARLESLMRLSSLAALCEAAFVEALCDKPRILLTGHFIRHLSSTLIETELSLVDNHILEPIANAISTMIRLGKWSRFRDSLIVKLLSRSISMTSGVWGLINLAVERQRMQLMLPTNNDSDVDSSHCITLCLGIVGNNDARFISNFSEIAQLSVERGYLGLLRKLLEGDDLKSPPRTHPPQPCAPATRLLATVIDGLGNNLLHISSRRAFIPVQKLLVECLGTVESRPSLSKHNSSGLTPLQVACLRRPDIDIVLLLLYAGADVNQRSATGRTALHYCFPSKSEVHNYLPGLEDFVQAYSLLVTIPMEHPRLQSAYTDTSQTNNPTLTIRAIIRQLYIRGANLSIKDRWGAAPAHLAAANGWGSNIDIFFLGSGEDVESMTRECLTVRDLNNNTVLALMRISGDSEGEAIIAEEMKKRNMDTSIIANPQNNTPIAETPGPPPFQIMPNYIQAALSKEVGASPPSSPPSGQKPFQPQPNGPTISEPVRSPIAVSDSTSPTFPTAHGTARLGVPNSHMHGQRNTTPSPTGSQTSGISSLHQQQSPQVPNQRESPQQQYHLHHHQHNRSQNLSQSSNEASTPLSPPNDDRPSFLPKQNYHHDHHHHHHHLYPQGPMSQYRQQTEHMTVTTQSRIPSGSEPQHHFANARPPQNSSQTSTSHQHQYQQRPPTDPNVVPQPYNYGVSPQSQARQTRLSYRPVNALGVQTVTSPQLETPDQNQSQNQTQVQGKGQTQSPGQGHGLTGGQQHHQNQNQIQQQKLQQPLYQQPLYNFQPQIQQQGGGGDGASQRPSASISSIGTGEGGEKAGAATMAVRKANNFVKRFRIGG
jgi:hypothetical protein